MNANATVIVVCDNPSHAGKVAKVSTFHVADGEVHIWDYGKRPRDRRERKRKADPAHPKYRNLLVDGVPYVEGSTIHTGGENATASCNLCGRILPNDPRVYRAVEVIAARDGYEHTVSLSEVAATVAKLEA